MKRLSLRAICLLIFLTVCGTIGWSQQPPPQASPVNVVGKWVLYCNDPNGGTSTKYLQLTQNGTQIKGHFKGPNQSGGVEGTINMQHLVVRTRTRDSLVFRGRIDGPRVDGVIQAQTFTGTFHAPRGTGTFQGQRTQ